MIWAHRVLKTPKLTHKINFYAPFLFHLNLQNKGHMGFNYCLWQVPPLCTETIFHPTPQNRNLLLMVKMLLSHHSSTLSLVSTSVIEDQLPSKYESLHLLQSQHNSADYLIEDLALCIMEATSPWNWFWKQKRNFSNMIKAHAVATAFTGWKLS